MSIDSLNTVWNEAPYGGAALLVLLALADYANDDGYSYPALDTVARKTRLSIRGVQKVMRVLEEDGWLTVEAGRGQNGTNRYRVNCVRGEQSGHPSSPDPSGSGSSSDLLSDFENGLDPSGSGVRRGAAFRPPAQGRNHGPYDRTILRN